MVLVKEALAPFFPMLMSDMLLQGRKVPEDVLAEVARQVLQGLSFLHRRHTVSTVRKYH